MIFQGFLDQSSQRATSLFQSNQVWEFAWQSPAFFLKKKAGPTPSLAGHSQHFPIFFAKKPPMGKIEGPKKSTMCFNNWGNDKKRTGSSRPWNQENLKEKGSIWVILEIFNPILGHLEGSWLFGGHAAWSTIALPHMK